MDKNSEGVKKGSPSHGAGDRTAARQELSREECLRLADGVPEPFAYIGRDERYRYVNERYEEFLGVSRTTVRGRHFGEVIGRDAYAQARPFVEQVLAGREVSFELRKSHPGGERWLSVAYRPDRTPAGVQGFFVLVTDVTQRKLAEAAAHQENDLNRALLDTLGALVVVLDREGRIVRFNRSCEQVTGFSFEEVQGRPAFELFIPPDEIESVHVVFDELLRGTFPNAHENDWLTKSGERRLIAWTNTSVLNADGSVQYVVGTGLDVTDQRRDQAELTRSREDLRKLNARLISAQEEVSSRLARELHDGLGQRVAALALQISELRDNHRTNPDTEGAFQTIQEEVNRLAGDVRSVSHQLHPTILKDLGLKAAIETECRQLRARCRVQAVCQVENLPETVSDDTQLALYRIVQEALSNVARHAHASQVSVTTTLQDRHLILAVQDDGCGFDPSAVGPKGGLGLTSMRERAHAAAGHLVLKTAPMQGSRVEVHLSVPEPEPLSELPS